MHDLIKCPYNNDQVKNIAIELMSRIDNKILVKKTNTGSVVNIE